MTNATPLLDDVPVHPADDAHLRAYAQGRISARDVARRVLERLGIEVPPALQGEWSAHAEPSLKSTAQMSEDTQAFSRGELDVAGWLAKAEHRYNGR